MGKAGGGAKKAGKSRRRSGKQRKRKAGAEKGNFGGEKKRAKKVLFRKVKECIKSVKMGENTLTR